MYDISPLQYLSKIFTCSSKVTVPHTRKGLVKVTFPSPLQYLNGSISETLGSLSFIFAQCTVCGSLLLSLNAILSDCIKVFLHPTVS